MSLSDRLANAQERVEESWPDVELLEPQDVEAFIARVVASVETTKEPPTVAFYLPIGCYRAVYLPHNEINFCRDIPVSRWTVLHELGHWHSPYDPWKDPTLREIPTEDYGREVQERSHHARWAAEYGNLVHIGIGGDYAQSLLKEFRKRRIPIDWESVTPEIIGALPKRLAARIAQEVADAR